MTSYRLPLYIIAGVTSALLGWNIGQFFLTDLQLLRQYPEVALFPCIAIALAVGMVLNEIFISNPTRPKINFRISKPPLLIAASLGAGLGLLAGIISQFLFSPQVSLPTPLIRTFGWLLIGVSVGLAEGLTWRWRSMEAGDTKRFQRRIKISVLGASAASLLAAGLFELVRSSWEETTSSFRAVEDPIGFSILGICLGLVFCFTNSPSYMAALRAGAGFEYTGDMYIDEPDQDKNYPVIAKPALKFVSDSNMEEIEEGLSIQLPATGKINIGAGIPFDPEKNNGKGAGSHIYIPGLPPNIASIEIKSKEAWLHPSPKFYRNIEVNGNRLGTSRPINLKHNYLLTFYPQGKEFDREKFYRFVYYNRFLDPQA